MSHIEVDGTILDADPTHEGLNLELFDYGIMIAIVFIVQKMYKLLKV